MSSTPAAQSIQLDPLALRWSYIPFTTIIGQATLAPTKPAVDTDPWNTQIYWVGPMLGSLLASAFYRFMKMLEYETANPGADFDELEEKHFDPEIHGSRPPTIISIQSGNHQNRNEAPTVTGAAADPRDPDGVTASPGNQTVGKPRHRGLSALITGRKEAGVSRKETEDLTDVYDAAPGAETGNASSHARS